MSLILNNAREAAKRLGDTRGAANIRAALDCLEYFETNSPISGEAESYANARDFHRLACEGYLKNMSFTTMLNLMKSYSMGEIIALPFSIGSRVYRVHKIYIPKEPSGWETTWTYDVVPYTLDMYVNKDLVFATEKEAKDEVAWKKVEPF